MLPERGGVEKTSPAYDGPTLIPTIVQEGRAGRPMAYPEETPRRPTRLNTPGTPPQECPVVQGMWPSDPVLRRSRGRLRTIHRSLAGAETAPTWYSTVGTASSGRLFLPRMTSHQGPSAFHRDWEEKCLLWGGGPSPGQSGSGRWQAPPQYRHTRGWMCFGGVVGCSGPGNHASTIRARRAPSKTSQSALHPPTLQQPGF